ncbi:hypothetical protein QUA70_05995 [Microcoleus sp. LAD1_D5]|uniref:hypothetical protein n=1 Tax=unclassified Microcoleus TaxID=2642155 RepID=UPI002FD16D00
MRRSSCEPDYAAHPASFWLNNYITCCSIPALRFTEFPTQYLALMQQYFPG